MNTFPRVKWSDERCGFNSSARSSAEPENTRGDAFGDSKLEQVIRVNHSRSASELTQQVLSEIRQWQPTSVDQKDDITLIVVDIVS
jgi:serine phosphatase RsbU (regulator of sigma subunit)